MLFYTPDIETAKAWVKDHRYDSYVRIELLISDTVDEYIQWNKASIREKAIAKLTYEERVALGLAAVR